MLSISRRGTIAAGVAALFLGLSGCGGANLGGTTNPYYGNYIGAYSESSSASSSSGTFSSFTIDPSGNLSATLVASDGKTTTATLTGTVADTTPPPANVSGTVTFPNNNTPVNYTGNINTLGHGWLMTITVSTTPAQTYSIVLVP